MRFTKALIAWFCSGGVFYPYKKLKLSIYLKPYFAISIMAHVAFLSCKKYSINIIHHGLGLYCVAPEALATLSKGYEFHSWNICLRFDTCLN